ncbi:hypothetical protein BHE74_00025198 [Ensete ventricosum]|nr:hypothetical protein GW17_00048511 [Ensete ventricosum]RWW67364.1 hypothetical protein BHE74_00025198 [Ensete ventricosum]RZS18605.1 hypothetical protein BHM03_00050904 [Ensete ventricosum]
MRECCHVIRGRIKSVLTHRALSFTEHLQMAGSRLPQDEEADKDQLGVLVPTAASSPSHRTPKKSLPWLPPASIIASTSSCEPVLGTPRERERERSEEIPSMASTGFNHRFHVES